MPYTFGTRLDLPGGFDGSPLPILGFAPLTCWHDLQPSKQPRDAPQVDSGFASKLVTFGMRNLRKAFVSKIPLTFISNNVKKIEASALT